MEILKSVRKEILELKEYAAGKMPKPSKTGKKIKLSSNENPFGSSPKAMKAIRRVAESDLRIYPDSKMLDLRSAVVDFWKERKVDVLPEALLFGDGSGEILNMLALSFIRDGDKVVIPEHSFSLYSLLSLPRGANVVEVARKDFRVDIDAILDEAQDAKIIFIANPDNPTSTFIQAEKLYEFIKKVPPQTAVVIDEAYIHFAGLENSLIESVEKFPNLIILHTLSKAFGLASLRAGYAVMNPELAKVMEKIRLPFNLGAFQQAGAAEALRDEEFLEYTINETRKGVDFLSAAFDELGLFYTFPFGNFFFVDFGEDYERAFDTLSENGVSVRQLSSFGFNPRYARITVGTMEENGYLIEILNIIFG